MALRILDKNILVEAMDHSLVKEEQAWRMPACSLFFLTSIHSFLQTINSSVSFTHAELRI